MSQRIVLLGAGNANLQVLRRWVASPLPDTELMIVSDSLEVPYSGMVPGFVNRTYGREQVVLDLVPLCGMAGALLVEATATSLDTANRRVVLGDRAVGYDWLAMNVGSEPVVPPGPAPRHSFSAKPLTHFMGELERLDRAVGEGGPFHLVVVGSGAGGAELTLALKKRYGKHSEFSLTLVDSHSRPLSSFSSRASRLFRKEFERAGVPLRLGQRVVGKSAQGVELADGQTLDCDGVLWVTRGTVNPFTEGLTLPKNDRGFVLIHDSLLTVGDPRVFATGDMVSRQGAPDLPKAGVFAVRQGPVLWDNLAASRRGEPLRPYRPQRRFLTLLNTSDGQAVGNYGPLSWKGTGAWRLKDWIDTRWLRKLGDLSRMSMEGEMRCGGCGAKVPPLQLQRALSQTGSVPASFVEVGLDARDDGAVFRLGDARVVESVDFFRGLPVDPHRLGQLATLNALSDLWAMGAEAKVAQAIVVLPEGGGQGSLLSELMGGIQAGLRQTGVTLVGGHTSEGKELALGLAVTGAAGKTLFLKSALRAGDRLVLTQPLGTGALLVAFAHGKLGTGHWNALWEAMLTSNADAAALFAAAGVRAATDITGFGLGGHLLEMLRASGVGARLEMAAVPSLPGFYGAVEKGLESTLAPGNRLAVEPEVRGFRPGALLFDPQTSGGLLGAVAEEAAEELVAALRQKGYVHAAVVGRVVEGAPQIDLT